jgi:ketosteroid isomerase-like protein
VNVEQERTKLMERDRAWSQTTKDGERFVSFIAADGSLYAPGKPLVTGTGPIRETFTKLSSAPGFALAWTPSKAQVSTAGDLGYTTGSYEFRINDAAGNPTTEKGKYVTLWKKQASGEWKVTDDIFNADAVAEAPTAPHTVVAASAITWGDAPPSLPPGAKLAVLAGDPASAGPFTIRAQFPAGYRIAPHWHPTDERVTVLSGTMAIGMGDAFEVAAMQELPATSHAVLPAKMHHYAMAKSAATIQIDGHGPFQINYLDPADDPRTQAK